MGLFKEPLPPPPPPGHEESLGQRSARLARQSPVAFSQGKVVAMGVLAVIAVGGVVASLLFDVPWRTPSMRRARQAAEEASGREAGPLPTLGVTPAPATPSAPVPPAPGVPGPRVFPAPPAPGAEDDRPDFAMLAASVALASEAERPVRRAGVLGVYAAHVDVPAFQRTIFIDAARLAPDAMPEEQALFQRVTRVALDHGLASADAAEAAVLYLGSLRDRGGIEGVNLLERLVLDLERPMELRLAAAHALPVAARPHAAAALAKQIGAHPALRAALR